MADEIRDILKKFPGIQFEVLTFLGDRIGETLTGETAPVVVNIFGDDLDVLDAKAAGGREGRSKPCPARRTCR